MTEDYIAHAVAFINEIASLLPRVLLYRELSRLAYEYSHTHDCKVRVQQGISRIVFVASDYVVKLDRNSEYNEFGNCETEYEMYHFMVEHGYGEYFAPVTKVTVNYHDFYIMPKVSGIHETDGEAWEWIAEKDETAADFIADNVDDLHNGNYGWENGHPVIIDYACKRLA